jgi:hypothetical protein
MPKGFEHFLLVTTDKLAADEKAIANHLQNIHYAYKLLSNAETSGLLQLNRELFEEKKLILVSKPRILLIINVF